MDIGFFTDTYYPQINGVTCTIASWKDTIKNENIYLYYPSSTYTPKKNEVSFRSIRFPFYNGYRIGIPINITKYARNLDIVHIHGLFSLAIAGIRVSRKFDLPCILTYHTPADRYLHYITKNKRMGRYLRKIYLRWERRILNSCDLITAPTTIIEKELEKKGFENLMTLSNGIDLNIFKPVDKGWIKKKYGIRAEKCIGYCGRFGYEKRLEDIINIADDFDGDILLAGDGPAYKYYKDLAKDKKNVKILGFLNRNILPYFYSALDAFIFPSTVETQGIVALEAMACGTPVVGAHALALKETITHGKTGYHYEVGDTIDLKDKIEKCYENRRKLSKNCLEYVKVHSVDRISERLLEIYDELLQVSV